MTKNKCRRLALLFVLPRTKMAIRAGTEIMIPTKPQAPATGLGICQKYTFLEKQIIHCNIDTPNLRFWSTYHQAPRLSNEAIHVRSSTNEIPNHRLPIEEHKS
jgi:hypothetical protein